jgi:hypothetical protein
VNIINWKKIIHSSLHSRAQDALDNCDFLAFICYASNEFSLPLLASVSNQALACGKLELAFVNAFIATRTNNRQHSETIKYLLQLLDPLELKKQGDKIPPQKEFRLYRGSSRINSFAKIKGYSWTRNLELAHWYAMRYPELGCPFIFTTTVSEDSILFYTNERGEDEFVLDPKNVNAIHLEDGAQKIADKYQNYINYENQAIYKRSANA